MPRFSFAYGTPAPRKDTEPHRAAESTAEYGGFFRLLDIVFILFYHSIQSRKGQAVLGRQLIKATPWLTERHGYDPTSYLE